MEDTILIFLSCHDAHVVLTSKKKIVHAPFNYLPFFFPRGYCYYVQFLHILTRYTFILW